MTEQQASYRQIMKATSIFGGVQVFNIIIQIIRSKVVAILLGPAGMGILGLLTSSISLISSITNFGIGTIAVKDIAAAHFSSDSSRIGIIVVVIRRLVWITGILGSLVTLSFSPWLSQITFGNTNYTAAFVWISITLLMQQISSGQLVILQGMRLLKQLALANCFGSAIGLIITLPLYYFFKIDGIVPGLIVTALITLCFSWFFSKRIRFDRIYITNKQVITEGTNMLRMGFLISLSALLPVSASYIVRILISQTGGG